MDRQRRISPPSQTTEPNSKNLASSSTTINNETGLPVDPGTHCDVKVMKRPQIQPHMPTYLGKQTNVNLTKQLELQSQILTPQSENIASTSAQEWTDKTYYSYTVRPGTIDQGKHYEAKMAALAALRFVDCKVETASVAVNAEACGDFDDLAVYRKTKTGVEKIYLVQLKHQENAKPLTPNHFLTDKGNFALNKYRKSYEELEKNCSINTLFNVGTINFNEIELILFTNKSVDIQNGNCTFLKECGSQDHFLQTGGMIYRFDESDPKLQTFPKQFLKMLRLFTNQTDVKNLDQLIKNEIKSLVPMEDKFISQNVLPGFCSYIENWSKGEFDGNYILEKDTIVVRLIGLVLDDHFKSLSDVVPLREEIFNRIVNQFDIILISLSDDKVLNYLRSYIHNIVNCFSVKSNLKREIIHSMREDLTEQYKVAWRLGVVPFLLVIDNENEYINVIACLNRFQCNRKFIIFSKNIKLHSDGFSGEVKVLTNLSDLSSELQQPILDCDVTLQGRGPVKLYKIVRNVLNYKTLLTSNDIIHILSNSFNIGNDLPKQPHCYVPRNISKILLNVNVLTKTNNIFVVISDERDEFKTWLKQNNLKYILFDSTDDITASDLNSNKCLIVFCKSPPSNLGDKLCNRETHYLKFHSGSNLIEWIQSSDDINQLVPYLEDALKDENDQLVDANSYRLERDYKTRSRNILDEFPSSINIISADPGMGKSVALDVIGLQVPTVHWVLRIDLNKHITYFDNPQNFHNEARKHLQHFNETLSIDQNCNDRLNKLIFDQFMKSRKILILLDGFDELVPVYKEQVTEIIISLKKEHYKFWLTTRPVAQLHLQTNFNSFTYTLEPFTEDDQYHFLNKYFCNNQSPTLALNDHIQQQINNFVERLLEITNKNLDHGTKDFMSVPLQTEMLASVYLKSCTNYIETGENKTEEVFDILYLYERFIEHKKEEIKKKYGDAVLMELRSFEDGQMLYAIKILFTYQIFDEMKYAIKETQNFVTKVNDGTFKNGIIVSTTTENPSFIHQTFAEYFAAKWLVANYINDKNPIYKNVANKLIEKLKEPSYQLIKNFFNRYLAQKLPLHRAVLNYNLGEIENTIQQNTSVINEVDGLKRTALHLMCSSGKQFSVDKDFKNEVTDEMQSTFLKREEEIAILLLEIDDVASKHLELVKTITDHHCLAVLNAFAMKIEDIDIPTEYLEAYLYHSAVNGFSSLLSIILKNYSFVKDKVGDFKIEHDGGDDLMLIHIAARAGQLGVIKLLLENNANIIVTNKSGENALHISSHNGHTEIIKFLISAKLDINSITKRGETALHISAGRGFCEIVEVLLSAGINVNAVDQNGLNALHIAIIHNDIDIFNLAFSKGIDINTTDIFGANILHYAVESGSMDMFNLVLSKGIDINTTDKDGANILHYAVESGSMDMFNLVLSKGIDINTTDKDGANILHYAVESGSMDMFNLVLSKGIDINTTDKDGANILHYAVESGSMDMFNLVLSKGIDINTTDKLGANVLHCSVRSGFMNMFELILLKGIDINTTDNTGRNILHFAIDSESKEMFKLVLSKGIDINKTNIYGVNILHYAAVSGSMYMFNLVLSEGIDINTTDKFGANILHYAVKSGSIDMFTLGLSKGIDIDATDNNGRNILHFAIDSKSKEMFNLVLSKGIDINKTDIFGANILHYAVQSGSMDMFNLVLSKGIDINTTDNNGRNILHFAIDSKSKEMFNLVLSKGIDINKTDIFGANILHYAVESGSMDMFELILSKGIDINTTDNKRRNWLHYAIDSNSKEMFNLFLSKGIDINTTDNKRRNWLHYTIDSNSKEMFNLVLSKGIDINTTDNKRRNCLHYAIDSNSKEMFNLVLSKGIDINKTDILGANILHYAVESGSMDMFELILLKEIDINMTDNSGRNILHYAILSNSKEMFDLVLSKGIDIKTTDKFGANILHWAVQSKSTEMFDLVLSKGIDINTTDKDGANILHYAVKCGSRNMFELILLKGIDINTTDNKGRNCLHYSIDSNSKEMFHLVLSKGIDINTTDKDGANILHYAVECGSMDMFDLVLSKGIDIKTKGKFGRNSLHYAEESGSKEIIELVCSKLF